MGALYLASLLVASGCMLLLDWRYRLYFWRAPLAAGVVTIVGVVFLLVWDAFGILLGIFLRGDSPIATGLVLAPELPIEEPVFLVFLVLCTMVVFTGTHRMIEASAARRSP
ncbi:MAG TPA: lycopene cyclase domain-containing protein [Terrimesophilobacter sp.]|nr:lycopene cyclase domain-containing protein [Terrimesophilobacter sp.]HRP99346.1 lycopene cyclase domain-containing protein [Terrimesophilobacter sp.]